jgi:hypothetical protein
MDERIINFHEMINIEFCAVHKKVHQSGMPSIFLLFTEGNREMLPSVMQKTSGY